VSTVEASTGFEPVNKDFADPRLTTWPRRHGNNKDCKPDISSICNPVFERAMRFELTTFSLARRRSTTELRPHALLRDCYSIYYAATNDLGSCCNFGCVRSVAPLAAASLRVDPVGFEPTIFSLQRRRLPARPRALAWSHSLAKTQCRREDSNLHT
jgi:hypothetical protein